MVRVIVIREGPTEERFIADVVAPALRSRQVIINAVKLTPKPGYSGGALTFDRLKHYAIKYLSNDKHLVLSTFFDLYALHKDFPAFAQASRLSDVYEKVRCLETALHQSVVKAAGCQPERFIPHIQPYEFEALLFSDVDALCSVEPEWGRCAPELHKMRAASESPEHINGSEHTAPSKRLLKTLVSPGYHKVRHGPQAAQKITLEVIERECHHFKSWMDTLRALHQE